MALRQTQTVINLPTLTIALKKQNGEKKRWNISLPTLPEGSTIIDTELVGNISWNPNDTWTNYPKIRINGTTFTNDVANATVNLGTQLRDFIEVESFDGTRRGQYTGTLSNFTYIIKYRYNDSSQEPTVYFGNTEITEIYYGDTLINEVFLGDIKIL